MRRSEISNCGLKMMTRSFLAFCFYTFFFRSNAARRVVLSEATTMRGAGKFLSVLAASKGWYPRTCPVTLTASKDTMPSPR